MIRVEGEGGVTLQYSTVTAPRPTLRSLATEAGVSPMTVSLALRNSAEISPAVRGRLQRLAAARGYRPDPHVAKLMHHLRTRAPARSGANLCGLTQTWPRATLGPQNFLDRLLDALRQRAESLGYAFSTLNLDDFSTRAQLQRVLVSRGVEGLLLLPLREPQDLGRRLDWSAFATVSVTSTVLAPHFHTVTPNHFDNMVRGCRALTRAGFRRIGLAMSQEWDARVNHRWSGGIAWQNQFGGGAPVVPLIDPRPGPDLDADTLAAWLAREKPDAVIFETLDRSVWERALRTVPRRRRPRVVTMNWPNPAADCGIDQRVERLGTVAVELLDAMLRRGERGVPDLPHATFIDGVWVARGEARRSFP